jgi:ribonuclease HI
MVLNIYTDGGSRGNPGPSGFGVVVYDESKKIISQISKFIGVKTNNEAEYSALLDALIWVKDNLVNYDISSLNFYSDSQLMVRQIEGRYKVKAPTIIPLYRQVMSLLQDINLPYKFNDIPRELNSLADALANQAMDRK